jgi:hypothetical protein
MDERNSVGASVPDQALVSDGAATHLHPSGFDPSRIADPVERAEAWQLHLYRMLDTERERSRRLHEQLDEMCANGIMAEVTLRRLTDAAKALVWQHFHPHDPLPGEPRTIGGAIRKIAEILDELFAIAMAPRQRRQTEICRSLRTAKRGPKASHKGSDHG